MTTDEQMITRAIKLAQESFEAGDSSFGCVVAKGKKIIIETKNRMKLDDDITAHAEIRAIRQMQKNLEHPIYQTIRCIQILSPVRCVLL